MAELEKVTFTLEGDPQEYTLCYDFNQICDAEAVAGANLLNAVANKHSMNAVQMRGLLYACLKTAHPDVLLKEAGTLLSRDSKTVTKALATVLGAEDEEAALEAAAKFNRLLAEAFGVTEEEAAAKLAARVAAEEQPTPAPAAA